MFNLLKVEFYKLKRSKVFYLFIVLMIMQSMFVLIPIKENYLLNKTGQDMFLQSFPLQEFIFNTLIIGAFGYFIGKEFHSGYIKNLIVSGHKRINIVLSKAIVFCIGVAIISFIFPICTFVINSIRNGYGEKYSVEYMFEVSVIMLFVYLAIGSIVTMISFITKNIAITIALFYLIDIINRFGTAMSLRNSTVKYFYYKTVFAIPSICILDKITVFTAGKMLFICLMTTAICTALSIEALKKADMK
ncbi:ABC-2 type transport system permease protein [Clostridium acetobutylicum]|uniref:Transmembrane protein n=1 Tax=Clostridium acetobutylicum (strain ATCC 824 / DSM 792 / JCM 1419 / IAM 19013 / LMG 5710 / NBRC 13948 / NRRL B-527 / VKM B-1787 / 2291 / W) TaxID=272562 RepID=Q97KQ5_CLOAB|nr:MULTISPECIES: ABC transporter permease [Clostridium]AAK78838.1 Transmembrane protein [Clostridium acetobutylicum ATCC 824]ADZ19913.1 Transmembrane protein [Clostridium acetobutylicum EA 2018]AEI31477.1 transmembrane protein [Clostridium acetobutylicum DSM 1731]AWV80557.1 ABC transporter permease [Clostridium acetobutylicum]MBC2392747.1 ABC transporter permease [Clostridium acetobutylicum]